MAGQLRLARLTATLMVARLDALLTDLDAVPVADWLPWHDGSTLYVQLRWGALPATCPDWWPWAHTLHGWELTTWRTAIRGHARDPAVWRTAWPAEAVAALDDRAYVGRVDTRRDWTR